MIDPTVHTDSVLAVIDFETCDLTSSAQVLTLGATFFNPTKPSTIDELEINSLYVEFTEQENRTFNMEVLSWWAKQSDEARNAAFNGEHKLHPYTALQGFNQWLQINKVTHLVGNGASFDNPILTSLYKQYDVKPRLPFWVDLDLRTMNWLDGNQNVLSWPKHLTKHHARHDAIYEAARFQQIYNKLNKQD